MRTDTLPLCDQHYRTMEFLLAPFNLNYSFEFFRCTEKFCQRCFTESLGYATPKRDEAPSVSPDQPCCERHGRPMFISSLDRQRNVLRYRCPEQGCSETALKG
jgi:hypothetical protein